MHRIFILNPVKGIPQVRYRVDEFSGSKNKLPRNVQAALVSRIKILSNLKIDERRVPQDGRFKVTVAGKVRPTRKHPANFW